MTSRYCVEVTEKSLDKNGLDELISISGYSVDMILQFVPDEGRGYFHIFAKYQNGQIVRQIYTQRKEPRRFKDIDRALRWGKTIGFKSVSLIVDYAIYPL